VVVTLVMVAGSLVEALVVVIKLELEVMVAGLLETVVVLEVAEVMVVAE
jgi:hypothetical protein